MERMKSMYGGALDYVPQEWCRVCSSVKVTSDWKASIYGKRTLCFSCHTLVKQHK